MLGELREIRGAAAHVDASLHASMSRRVVDYCNFFVLRAEMSTFYLQSVQQAFLYNTGEYN